MFDPIPEDVIKIIIDAGSKPPMGGEPMEPMDKPSIGMPTPKTADELLHCIHDMICEYLGTSDPMMGKDKPEMPMEGDDNGFQGSDV